MDIKFQEQERYDINNEGLLFQAIVNGEKVTCVVTREALWEGFSADQVLSLEEAFRAGRETIERAAVVLIEQGAPQPIVVKRAHVAPI
ncbi:MULTISPECIES: DUF1488 domain-containing protein [Cupriavidus]|jgi:hypothetical protein|uniref:DUF1488 domain-containing protein n=1 Tax=Cupriavidus oxalaticus TaxID=96344 RepID=A0A375GFI3_9BURK|nr:MULTISPECIES: DUF1488 domain-containing protein [Cupriavidus]MBF6989785.1 DUF1488 domain-containing protein [Cupriavidus sp. IK-TO18]MBP0620481.1 DUF1488 domain-containing protein [Cupriavidus sp. LEh25]MBP0628457.1 DUF1488 domain-containing protein [Cupriavidus sp. AcVe19-1a]MBP0636928.1 DUF1488 domain-containing protein [Cupriavidus sp. AcVe19-6a]MDK2657139.1 DUF1488 domain-containing protein [Cupriavidus sp. LEh21]